ncbi:MAG: helix-turn-helix transcriptional regulator [Clostridia bacterium]|nr:helix-turn-helix transcriptional regulator [Clostridia bacterium]MBQ8743532.1 helix-turn-helix transcriptional regulator [Clostridia bacterium]
MDVNSYFFRVQHKRADLSFYAHAHAEFEIIAVTDGCLTVCVNQTKIFVESGNALFLPSYYIHSFETQKHSLCHIWEFSSRLVFEKLPSEVVMFPIPEDTSEFFYHTESSDGVIACKATVYRILSMMDKEIIKRYSLQMDDIISGAIRFITENFSDPITLQDVSNHLNVNYSYLSRMFKKYQGMSFTECLNATRLSRAVALLEETNMTVTDIALSCGFGSTRNFNRIFASKMRCSPRDFRKDRSFL